MKNIIHNLVKLWLKIDRKSKIQILLVSILTLVSSIMEVASIGSVMPFIAAATGTLDENNKYLLLVEKIFPIGTPKVIVFGILFGTVAVLSGILRLSQLLANTRASFEVGSDVSGKLYAAILQKDYIEHLQSNSSDFMTLIITKSNAVLYGIVLPLMMLISSGILLGAIYIGLFFIDPLFSTVTIGTFVVIYLIFSRLVKNKLSKIGVKISEESDRMTNILQQSFLSIKEIMIDGAQRYNIENFLSCDRSLRAVQASGNIYSAMPRYFIETCSMIVIAVLAVVTNDDGASSFIPLLGAMGLAITKALPLFQQCFWSLAQININIAQLSDVNSILDCKYLDMGECDIKYPSIKISKMSLQNVSYSYPDANYDALKEISFEIEVGSVVGVLGESGSGKSTLMNILMGLLPPTNGELKYMTRDNKRVPLSIARSRMAHVPQEVYIENNSIIGNIHMPYFDGSPDLRKIENVLHIVGLEKYITNNGDIRTVKLGENGCLLSGGERQRIGVARALYKNADLIFFDEITSALDENSERVIVSNIKSVLSDKIVIIITHRPEILKICDKILSIKNAGAVIYENRA